jgi:hypothetical protein
LSKLYDVSGAKTNMFCDMWVEIGEPLEFDTGFIHEIVQYLADEGLIDNHFSGPHPHIGITHKGIREVEQARSNPDQPTPHFPAQTVIYNSGTITNSPIQQASRHAVQNFRINAGHVDDIRQFLTELHDKIEQLHLAPGDRNDLEAEVMTIEAQMQSSKPRRSTIQASMESIVKILEGASGNVLATLLIEMARVIVGA